MNKIMDYSSDEVIEEAVTSAHANGLPTAGLRWIAPEVGMATCHAPLAMPASYVMAMKCISVRNRHPCVLIMLTNPWIRNQHDLTACLYVKRES